MNCRQKMALIFVVSGLLIVSAAGCTSSNSGNISETAVSDAPLSSTEWLDEDEMFTNRDKEIGYDESSAVKISLSDDGIACDSKNVEISGFVVTISQEGTYILSGNLSDGQIVVDAEDTDKIQLVLNGVNINCNTSAVLYVKQADKVFVT